MSSNDIVDLTSPSKDFYFDLTRLSNDFDLSNKRYVGSNYVENNFNEKLIKVLGKELKEISERLYSIEVTIKNKMI